MEGEGRMWRGCTACPKKTVPQGCRLVAEYPVPWGWGSRLQTAVEAFLLSPSQNPSTPRAHCPVITLVPPLTDAHHPTPPHLPGYSILRMTSMGTCKAARPGSPVTEAFPGDPTVKTEWSTTRQQKPGPAAPRPIFHLHPQVPSAQLQALKPPWLPHVHC